MPLIYHDTITPDGELGLWRITEPEDELAPALDLSPEEEEQLARMKGHRRIEWLAVRRLVHDMSGRFERMHFVKDKHGKPHLQHHDWHMSISHSRTICAAIVSPLPVGIDIQQIVPKIERIAHKFMRPEEMASLQPDTRLLHLHVYWGAKEALYKAYGRRQLDFREHIHIAPFAFAKNEGSFTGEVKKGLVHERYRLRYHLEGEDYVLVYGVLEDRG